MARFVVAFATALLFASPLVSAEQSDPAAAIEIRRQGFKDMGAAFKGIRDQFRRPKPALVMIREYTKPLVNYSKEPVLESWFPQGSGPAPGVDTEALPVIWEKPGDFAALWEDYVQATGKLQTAVAAGDLDAARQWTREVGNSCSSCHDTFREETD